MDTHCAAQDVEQLHIHEASPLTHKIRNLDLGRIMIEGFQDVTVRMRIAVKHESKRRNDRPKVGLV